MLRRSVYLLLASCPRYLVSEEDDHVDDSRAQKREENLFFLLLAHQLWRRTMRTCAIIVWVLQTILDFWLVLAGGERLGFFIIGALWIVTFANILVCSGTIRIHLDDD